MTIKLYENDSYLKSFEATVLSCESKDGFYYVILDKTAFFPEGGGQPADLGTIDDANVLDVQIADNIITHKTDKPFDAGQRVEGVIDWDLRFARMQNHSGEHIISGTIHSMFGYNNVGFHMNDKTMTVDVDGALTADDIKKIELASNKVVFANKRIYADYPTPQQLETLDYRSKLDITEGVRLIYIEDCDCCACCAPHVARTGEIGTIKILDFAPHRSGTRIEMVCGVYALEDYCYLHSSVKGVMGLLSAPRDNVLDAVNKVFANVTELRNENNRLSEQVVMAQLDKISINSSICAFAYNATYNDLRYCSNILVNEADYCALFSKSDDDYIYVISSQSNNVQNIVKALNAEFNGKGGGRPNYAQGKIVATCEQIIEFLSNTL